ncbi:lysosomal acid phosphatase isoform X2 [Orussus abietinus]|uniref:lysosomal acid phosphatase isoform X2 n=1 Tax=Orussus abietinus TaxID=222816 RepID=UPI0006269D48|nr:lysosomal acid phosphatase isoform X2 [Orussus abietinus]
MIREMNSKMSRPQTSKRGIFATVVVLAIVIGSALFAYTAFGMAPRDSGVVQQVAIIFRHGDRTPTETYPNDPHLTHNWSDGWGALTKEGMLQLYNLGQYIRKEYGWLAGIKYHPSIMLVQSSYADRCIMSAQSLLASLYTPNEEDVFFPGLAWRPVPIIAVKEPCPRLEKELEQAYINESLRSGTELASYYAKLTHFTGKNITTITDVEFLYNTLEIEEQNKLTLPEWTKEFYNSKMRELAARSLALFTSNTLQQRLRGGPILKEILSNMMSTRVQSDYKKMYLYSAHDTTLVNTLRTMGFTEELLKPDYGAALIFELLLINGGQNQEVKVMYLNNTQTRVPYPLTIPKCSEPCLLENLLTVWKDVLPTDWKAECQLQ